MPRTKDLVLFVLAFLFLVMAIGFTLAKNEGQETPINNWVNFTQSSTETEYQATFEEAELDRESNIARLRQAIVGQEVVKAPVVSETSVTTDSDAATTTTAEPFTLNTCESMKDAINFARTWPRGGVEISTVEGVRLVAKVEIGPISEAEIVGTTTTPAVTKTDKKLLPLVTLPLNPSVLAEPGCLGSEIVGISLDGSLLFNSDAIAYKTRGQNELLGYARDGFPIYGLYTGGTDECGGYQTAAGYRYTVTADQGQFLGCYRADPQTFIGE